MTGIDVADPFGGSPTGHFDELESRAVDLDTLANSACIVFVDSNERFKDFGSAHQSRSTWCTDAFGVNDCSRRPLSRNKSQDLAHRRNAPPRRTGTIAA